MAQYKVVRNCYGFQDRYWREGDVVEIDPKENPPHHFQLVEEGESAVPVVESQEPRTLSEAAHQKAQGPITKRGRPFKK